MFDCPYILELPLEMLNVFSLCLLELSVGPNNSSTPLPDKHPSRPTRSSPLKHLPLPPFCIDIHDLSMGTRRRRWARITSRSLCSLKRNAGANQRMSEVLTLSGRSGHRSLLPVPEIRSQFFDCCPGHYSDWANPPFPSPGFCHTKWFKSKICWLFAVCVIYKVCWCRSLILKNRESYIELNTKHDTLDRAKTKAIPTDRQKC